MTDAARAGLAAFLADWLTGGQLVVSDGQATAAAVLTVTRDGATVVAAGVFDERSANFHWRSRDVLAADGTLIDRLAEDHGEKMLGAVWTLEIPLAVLE